MGFVMLRMYITLVFNLLHFHKKFLNILDRNLKKITFKSKINFFIIFICIKKNDKSCQTQR